MNLLSYHQAPENVRTWKPFRAVPRSHSQNPVSNPAPTFTVPHSHSNPATYNFHRSDSQIPLLTTFTVQTLKSRYLQLSHSQTLKSRSNFDTVKSRSNFHRSTFSLKSRYLQLSQIPLQLSPFRLTNPAPTFTLSNPAPTCTIQTLKNRSNFHRSHSQNRPTVPRSHSQIPLLTPFNFLTLKTGSHSRFRAPKTGPTFTEHRTPSSQRLIDIVDC